MCFSEVKDHLTVCYILGLGNLCVQVFAKAKENNEN